MERGKLSLPSSIKLSSGNASFNRKLSNTLNYQTEQQKEKQKWEGTKKREGTGMEANTFIASQMLRFVTSPFMEFWVYSGKINNF